MLLEENTRNEVKKFFQNLVSPVKLVAITHVSEVIVPGHECVTCKDNQVLIEEVASLSDMITVETYDFLRDKERIKQYSVDKIPVTIVEGEKDFGIRLYGIPAGHEFATLLNAIKIVSTSDSELTEKTKEKLKSLSKPVHIQVFVTLSCPYCAPAAAVAHRMALESKHIRADMINAQEFPDFAQKYSVYAVPKIVINESNQFEGALPEDSFLNKIMDSV